MPGLLDRDSKYRLLTQDCSACSCQSSCPCQLACLPPNRFRRLPWVACSPANVVLAVHQEETLPRQLSLDRTKTLSLDSWKQLCDHRWDGMVHSLPAPDLSVGGSKDGHGSSSSALRRLKAFHMLEGFLRWDLTAIGATCCMSCSACPTISDTAADMLDSGLQCCSGWSLVIHCPG